MKLKPTLRRGGQRMVTLRVEHHLDRELFLEALCAYAHGIGLNEDGDLSAAKVIELVRAQLRDHGSEQSAYWADEVDEDEAKEVREWAEQQVQRVWP